MDTESCKDNTEEDEKIDIILLDDLRELLLEDEPRVWEIHEDENNTPDLSSDATECEHSGNNVTLDEYMDPYGRSIELSEEAEAEESVDTQSCSSYAPSNVPSRSSSDLTSIIPSKAVVLSKITKAKTIRVTHASEKVKMTIQELSDYLTSQRHLKKLTIGEAFDIDENGFSMEVNGHDRSTILQKYSYVELGYSLPVD
jgi:hypothetical protein